MILLLAISVFATGQALEHSSQYYTTTWAVEIDGGEDVANEIASHHGFINRGKIDSLGEVYEFELIDSHSISKSAPDTTIKERLSREPFVRFNEQQVMEPLEANSYQVPQDPLFSSQWQLVNTGQIGSDYAGNDLRVEQAWMQGLTGCNVTVTIVDDGVEFRHKDLWNNYVLRTSYDVIDEDNNPFNSNKAHGTRVAGVVGAEQDNDTCGVGIAHEVNLGGIRLLSRPSDLNIAKSLSYRRDIVDIYSNSWSPHDNGRIAQRPQHFTNIALEHGVREGRDGKGSIFVFGSGNGGTVMDDCAANGYVSSIFTIAVGSIGVDGIASSYDETCSSKLAVTYVTNERGHDSVSTTDASNGCTSVFGGTSASAPMATGIIALALQANPSLKWRDVQYLIVYTSNSNATAGPLITNCAGLAVSRQYGFGVMDAEAMVTRARHWISVPPQLNDSIIPPSPAGLALFQSPYQLTINYGGSIEYMEQVVVSITLNVFGSGDERRGDTVVELVSPQGTVSTLLNHRPNDGKDYGPTMIGTLIYNAIHPIRKDYSNWPFSSVMFWGENPAGEWTLTIRSVNSQTSINITDVQFQFFGVMSIPEAVANIPSQCHSDCSRGCACNGSEFCDSCVSLRNAYTLECINQCPPHYTEHNGYCYDARLPKKVCNSPMKLKGRATCRKAGYTEGCCTDEFCQAKTELNRCFCDAHCFTYGDCCSDIADIGCTKPNKTDTELCGLLQSIPVKFPYPSTFRPGTEGVETHQVYSTLSSPIYVDFPFGDNTIKPKVQIGKKGYFTFDGFNGTTPFLFNGKHSIVAPFFHGVDLRNRDFVSYEIHTPNISSQIVSDVNELIKNCTGNDFNGRWLLVAQWMVGALESLFQGLLITDFANSYAVFTYNYYWMGALFPGEWKDVSIGFSDGNGSYVNHEASFRLNADLISTMNKHHGIYQSNVIYSLSNNENECKIDNGGCEQVCVDTFESYECVCTDGYLFNNETGRCEDIDECLNSNHGCSHFCTNTIGSYNCTCPEGYILHDVDNHLCQRQCPVLTDPDHGSVIMTGRSVIDIANYSCDNLYQLQGESLVTCTRNGTWSSPPPICTPTFPLLPVPTNGAVEYVARTEEILEAIFICDTGYSLVGYPVLVYNQSSWDKEPPQCNSICSVIPPQILAPERVDNVSSPECGRLEWEAQDGVTYKLRFYTGTSYATTPASIRKIISSPTNSYTFAARDIPVGRPLYVIVKARNSNGVHSLYWSTPIIAAGVGCLEN